MSFSLSKFFGGFNIFKGDVFGKLLFLMVIASLCIGIYHFITRSTYSQKAEEIVNVEYHYPEKEEQIFLGLKLPWGFKIGITKEKSNVRMDSDSVARIGSSL